MQFPIRTPFAAITVPFLLWTLITNFIPEWKVQMHFICFSKGKRKVSCGIFFNINMPWTSKNLNLFFVLYYPSLLLVSFPSLKFSLADIQVHTTIEPNTVTYRSLNTPRFPLCICSMTQTSDQTECSTHYAIWFFSTMQSLTF